MNEQFGSEWQSFTDNRFIRAVNPASERETKMMKYQVCTLDVWGNEIDGYECNDFFKYAVIDASELEDFDAFCREHLIGEPSQYELDACSTDSFYELRHKETGKPIMHFQAIFELD